MYYSLGESTAKDKSNTKKIGFIYTPSHNFEVLENLNLEWSIDISHANWQNLYGSDLKASSLIPMFQYPIDKASWWHIKFGIGVAYVNQTRCGNRRLGDNWMFEDKLALGISLYKSHQLAVSISHYSNAQTNKHNDGLNIISLVYQYQW